MIFINEWLPNPAGSDKSGEWIELFNSGPDDIALNGWVIKNKSGQKFILQGQQIAANSYLVLPRNQTKLVFRNSQESVYLYNERGQAIDQSGFWGVAPEGKSFSRNSDRFFFTEPTPGRPNKTVESALTKDNNPFNQSLNQGFNNGNFLLLMVGSALILTLSLLFIFRRNENLSKLFFGRNQEAGPKNG